jgi:hypothetical protein
VTIVDRFRAWLKQRHQKQILRLRQAIGDVPKPVKRFKRTPLTEAETRAGSIAIGYALMLRHIEDVLYERHFGESAKGEMG